MSRLGTSDGHLPPHLEPDNQGPSGKGKALDLGMSYEMMDVRDDGDEGGQLAPSESGFAPGRRVNCFQS